MAGAAHASASHAYTYAHAAFEKLKKTRLSEEQARAICEVVEETQVTAVKGLATEQSVLDLRRDMDSGFEAQRNDNKLLRTELSAIKSVLDIIKWGVGIMAAGMVGLLLKAVFTTTGIH